MPKQQKTLDKQTAAFFAAVMQCMPDLSGEWMQTLMGNPQELKVRLESLRPTFLELVASSKPSHVEVIRLDPNWDFLILRSTFYPEVGLAVSNLSGSLGRGLRLGVRRQKEYELFVGPCGCCVWSAGYLHGDDKAAKLLRQTCNDHGIRNLIFHCWSSAIRQDVGDLHLIDPYGGVMGQLNKTMLLNAFGWLQVLDNEGNFNSILSLFES